MTVKNLIKELEEILESYYVRRYAVRWGDYPQETDETINKETIESLKQTLGLLPTEDELLGVISHAYRKEGLLKDCSEAVYNYLERKLK